MISPQTFYWDFAHRRSGHFNQTWIPYNDLCMKRWSFNVHFTTKFLASCFIRNSYHLYKCYLYNSKLKKVLKNL